LPDLSSVGGVVVSVVLGAGAGAVVSDGGGGGVVVSVLLGAGAGVV